MRTRYYREQVLEGIAREVITAYDQSLYHGVPTMIPIEDIIEAQGLTLEFQCLRKNGCVLGETIFDDGGAVIYDRDIPGYTIIEVKSGTILIDDSLCGEDIPPPDGCVLPAPMSWHTGCSIKSCTEAPERVQPW